VDNQDLNDLKSAFLQHEAVCEERWKTIFNELRDGKEESKERWAEVKVSVQALHRLVWAGGGAVILFLAGMIAAGNVL
jgi:hypothetical protein